MNIGVFYQSGHKFAACYMALQQLRTIYPDIPVALWEDGSNILLEIATKFNCNYTRVDQTGSNDKYSGRAVIDLKSNLKFFDRIYHSLLTSLKDVDWILFYEDDVWCKRKIERLPIFDLNGALGPLYTPELYSYLKQRFNITDDSRGVWSNLGSLENYQACGGTIWNKEKFIEAYKKLNEIDWDIIYKLDNRPCEWADASLSFIFQHAGLSVGRWDDWGPYDTKNKGQWWNKTGWSAKMEEQGDFAFIHGYKHFYNYSQADIMDYKI